MSSIESRLDDGFVRPNAPSKQAHALLVHKAVEMSDEPIFLDEEYAKEMLIRNIDDEGRISISHRLAFRDGNYPVHVRFDYHIDPQFPEQCNITYEAKSIAENLCVSSKRPRHAIAQRIDTGEVLEVIDPQHLNGADPRSATLLQTAYGILNGNGNYHHPEAAAYMMTEQDAFTLINMMNGEPAPRKPTKEVFSGPTRLDRLSTKLTSLFSRNILEDT